MMKRLRKVFCLLLIGAAMAAAPLQAAQKEGMTLEQAAAMVRQQTGGTILAAEPRTVNGKLMYRIKVLTKQRHVRSVWIDPGEAQKKR